MLKNTLTSLFVGTLLSFGGLFIDSASAQTAGQGSDIGGGNLSDIGGGNISDNSGGNISDNGGGNLSDITGNNTSIFTQAGGLNSQIIAQGEQAAVNIIEAFNAATPGNLQSEQLNALLKQTDKFLEDIDIQVETANSAIANRLW